jgi:hypothetical protein
MIVSRRGEPIDRSYTAKILKASLDAVLGGLSRGGCGAESMIVADDHLNGTLAPTSRVPSTSQARDAKGWAFDH